MEEELCDRDNNKTWNLERLLLLEIGRENLADVCLLAASYSSLSPLWSTASIKFGGGG
jgi:hypothetical protein